MLPRAMGNGFSAFPGQHGNSYSLINKNLTPALPRSDLRVLSGFFILIKKLLNY